MAILNSNLIPLPNAPFGCNFSLPNLNADLTNLDPQDPNHCYNTSVSPSTYWRGGVFPLSSIFIYKTKGWFSYVHHTPETPVTSPQLGILGKTPPTVDN